MRKAEVTMSCRRSRHAFTLTEVLIVIGLIILVVTMTVASFSVMTGGRSTEAATNIVAAALARARQDAMAMQEPYGVVFFPDADTGRTVVAEVYYPDFRNNRMLLDLVPDREELELPVGIAAQVMPYGNGNAPTDGAPTPPLPTIGVICFDGTGKVSVRPYIIESQPDLRGNENRLARRIGKLPPLSTPPTSPLGTVTTNPHTTITTQFGALLYDRAGYEEQPDDDARYRWLKDNATPILLNRYNGMILPSR